MTESREERPSEDRRAVLKKLGRFAVVSAPVVTLMLAAGSKPAKAVPCSNCGSSRAFKTPESGIDTAAVLAAIARLPVETWHDKSKTDLETRRHIGPNAEDFRAAFGVGDGVTISRIDAVGVCLAAVQSLTQRIESLEGQLQRATHRLAA
jgi:hypothetical protein